MNEVKVSYTDYFNFYEYSLIIWAGKWKILAFASATLTLVILFQIFVSKTKFTATTEIKPITSYESDIFFSELNSLDFFQINAETLLDMYIEILNDREVLEQVIKEQNIIDPKSYKDDKSYKEAITLFASLIEIIPPTDISKSQRSNIKQYWTLRAKYHDELKWREYLSTVNKLVNSTLKSTVTNLFNTKLNISNLIIKFEDENINMQIDNSIRDYERETSDNLEYLNEQSALAKELGIISNTLQSQSFDGIDAVALTSFDAGPYYLRGFKAIEKEINLIKSRQNIYAFVTGLHDLEKIKRDIEQNKSMEIVRAKTLFKSTPILNDEFSAASLDVNATNFKKLPFFLIIALSIAIGSMLGVVYLIIEYNISKYRNINP